ncbi:MAG: ribosomal protein L24 [uncultured bacterium]|nr:MAG: ribosomal protein L24 [uncultured bacterium]HBH18056.1 50S ribosomal protein L24 [Cyanobacteria bacterium UBA9579]
MASANHENKLHVKTGDRVLVISGKDKGKIGNIKKAMPKESRVVVEGVNIVTKAMKPNPMKNIQGGLVKFEAPIQASNVMLYCSKCEKPSRIRHEVLESGKKVRVCKKCGEQVD